MIKEFNSIEEIEKYYDEESNTYVFKENDAYIDLVVFNFDLDVEANIWTLDIIARNIKAKDIDVSDIKVCDINANNIIAHNINALDIRANNIIALNIDAINIIAKDISYYAVCFAYYNITCNSIKGILKNAKHFVLDGKIEVTEND